MASTFTSAAPRRPSLQSTRDDAAAAAPALNRPEHGSSNHHHHKHHHFDNSSLEQQHPDETPILPSFTHSFRTLTPPAHESRTTRPQPSPGSPPAPGAASKHVFPSLPPLQIDERAANGPVSHRLGLSQEHRSPPVKQTAAESGLEEKNGGSRPVAAAAPQHASALPSTVDMQPPMHLHSHDINPSSSRTVTGAGSQARGVAPAMPRPSDDERTSFELLPASVNPKRPHVGEIDTGDPTSTDIKRLCYDPTYQTSSSTMQGHSPSPSDMAQRYHAHSDRGLHRPLSPVHTLSESRSSFQMPSPVPTNFSSHAMLPSPSSMTYAGHPSLPNESPIGGPSSAHAAHLQDLQHQVTVKTLALATLQREYDSLVQKLERQRTKTLALSKKSEVSDAEINSLMTERDSLQERVMSLEQQVDEVHRKRDEEREQSAATGAQYMRMLDMAGRLHQKGERKKATDEADVLRSRVAELEARLASQSLTSPSREFTLPPIDASPRTASLLRSPPPVSAGSHINGTDECHKISEPVLARILHDLSPAQLEATVLRQRLRISELEAVLAALGDTMRAVTRNNNTVLDRIDTALKPLSAVSPGSQYPPPPPSATHARSGSGASNAAARQAGRAQHDMDLSG